jgi:hypothetical protein
LPVLALNRPNVLRFLSRFFPETIFSRRLSPGGERRLRLAQARAEEQLVEAHVRNALLFVDALAEDVSYDRAIDVYVRELAIPEPLASTVATRALVKLGEAFDPALTQSALDAVPVAPLAPTPVAALPNPEPAPLPRFRIEDGAPRPRAVGAD